MEIDEIVDYATNSPENTNPAVLRSMLSQLSGGGSSGSSPYVIETMWDDTIGEYGAVRTVKTAAEIYEICNAALEAGVPVLCGDVEGRVFEVYCEEVGDEADGDLRYVFEVTIMQIPTDFNSTTIYVGYRSTAVLIADVNDHPFVFHESSYGFSAFGWTIPLTPAT